MSRRGLERVLSSTVAVRCPDCDVSGEDVSAEIHEMIGNWAESTEKDVLPEGIPPLPAQEVHEYLKFQWFWCKSHGLFGGKG